MLNTGAFGDFFRATCQFSSYIWDKQWLWCSTITTTLHERHKLNELHPLTSLFPSSEFNAKLLVDTWPALSSPPRLQTSIAEGHLYVWRVRILWIQSENGRRAFLSRSTLKDCSTCGFWALQTWRRLLHLPTIIFSTNKCGDRPLFKISLLLMFSSKQTGRPRGKKLEDSVLVVWTANKDECRLDPLRIIILFNTNVKLSFVKYFTQPMIKNWVD